MSPRDKATQARKDAMNLYYWHASYYLIQGDRLADIDHDGAYAHWCDGMKALDAALTTEQGLEEV